MYTYPEKNFPTGPASSEIFSYRQKITFIAYMKHHANEIISGSASTPVDSGSKSLVNFKGRTTFGREGILLVSVPFNKYKSF